MEDWPSEKRDLFVVIEIGPLLGIHHPTSVLGCAQGSVTIDKGKMLSANVLKSDH